jgi:hypothetical protein
MHLVCPGTVSIEPKPRSEVTYLLNGGTGLHSAESSVSAMTFRYWSSTSGLLKSRWKDRVCFIHLSLFISSTLMMKARKDSLITVGEVLSGVGTSGLLSCGGRNDSLDSVLHNVPELKGLDQIAGCQHSSSNLGNNLRVPDHTPVLDSDLVVRLVDIVHLLDTLIQR